MARNERIARASADEFLAMRKHRKTRSDWAAAERMSQADAERSADEDDGALPEGWECSVEIGPPEPAQSVNIRLDAAVPRRFKARGPGYQTRINAVARNPRREQEVTLVAPPDILVTRGQAQPPGADRLTGRVPSPPM